MLPKLLRLFIICSSIINCGLIYPAITMATPSQQTGTCSNSISHSNNTEHRMKVCGDGNITTEYNLFYNDTFFDSGKDGLGNLTTMGIHFDQHGNNQVDIGWQGDFQPIIPIRFNRPAYFGPYSEETYTIYKSRNLSYEIEQRTLTVDSPWGGTAKLGMTDNWTVMELLIRNTGTINLTGGRLLYMADFDPGRNSSGHKGFYDATVGRGVAYHTQQPNPSQPYSDRGFGMGFSLLSGTLLGHGLSTASSYPNNDSTFLTQMTLPMYAANQSVAKAADSDRADYISWLVIQIPPLTPGIETKLAIGWCASVNTNANTVATLIKSCFDKPYLPALTIQKNAPITGYIGIAMPLTYTVSSRYDVPNLSVTSLVDSLVGNIPITGLGSYQINYTIAPTVTSPLVSTITVQGAYGGVGVISQTITHSWYIDYQPKISLTVTSFPEAQADIAKEMTYFITATHAVNSDLSSVMSITMAISKSNSINLISGDTNGNGWLENGEQWVYQAKYTPILNDPNPLLNMITLQGRDLNSELVNVSVTQAITLAHNPEIQIIKTGPDKANAKSVGAFTFRISHASNSDGSAVNIISVSDDKAGLATETIKGSGFNIGDNNENKLLDQGEEWYYTAGFQFQAVPNPLVNIANVTWKDLENEEGTSQSNSHTTHIIPSGAIFEVTKFGPRTVKVGDEIPYVIQIRHNQNSGGDPVTITKVIDSLFHDPIDLISAFKGGDVNKNNTLDFDEIFIYEITYSVTEKTKSPIINEVTVEGVDKDNHLITVGTTRPVVTEIEYNSGLVMQKEGPAVARVNDKVVYTFTLEHSPLSDGGSIFFANIEDNVTGVTATCPQKGNGDLFINVGEVWHCRSNIYTIQPTDPPQLMNIATAYGSNKAFEVITATANHTTLIDFQPQLMASMSQALGNVQIGDILTYTITLQHGVNSDQSPIKQLMVTDNLGGAGSCPLEQLVAGQIGQCVVTTTIPITTINPLTLTSNIHGIDGNGESVEVNTQSSVDILFKPVIELSLTAPETASRGESIQYQITLSHTTESDKSEVCNLTLNSDLWAIPLLISYNGDNCLGQGEIWPISIPYQIPQTASVELINTVSISYTTLNGVEKISDLNRFTTTLIGAAVQLTIQPNPINLTVGQKAVTTYQVTRLDDTLERVDSRLALSSSLFGLATRTRGGDPLFKDDIWEYEAHYTPLPTTPHQQTVEVVAIHEGRIIGRGEVTLIVNHNPQLTLRVVNHIGGIYTFRLEHSPTSDNSPVIINKINDQDLVCSLLADSRCEFTATVPINANNYTALVEYIDLDSTPDVLTHVLQTTLSISTFLPIILIPRNDSPVLILEKNGPQLANAGERITYKFRLRHDMKRGDGTAVCNIKLVDSLIPNLSQIPLQGDTNGNTCLNKDEIWEYVADYIIPVGGGPSVDNRATVTGNSSETSKVISATATWLTLIANRCKIETFDNSNSGWQKESNDKVDIDYNGGTYVITSRYTDGLHFVTSPIKPIINEYIISVKANWNEPMGDEYGLVFNVLGRQDKASMYVFNIRPSDGYYKLRLFRDGIYKKTLSSGISPYIKGDKNMNELQLQRTGNTFRLYVNQQFLAMVSNDELELSTKVGLDMLPSLTKYGQSMYDNFTICSNNGVIPSEEKTSINLESEFGIIDRP